MLTSKTHKLSQRKIIELLSDAKNAEMCRDIESSRAALAAVWQDIDRDPDFSDFEPTIRAELLRLCGFFLSWHGHSSCIVNYQQRGKDLLTEACRIFEEIGFADKMAEARVMLALCYWYEGEIEECETILRFTEHQFQGNELHPVYLQVRVNRLLTMFWKKDFQNAGKLIKELEIPMDLCQDFRLKTMYHNQAGVYYELLKKFDQSAYHQHEAIRFAKRIKSVRFVGANLNNLALLHSQMGENELAHRYLEESLAIFQKLNDNGWIPHVLDSKAVILKNECRYEDALAVVDEALPYLRRGEDYSGLVNSLWTKTAILLFLERKVQALMVFKELSDIAVQRIGEYALEKYAALFAEAFFVVKNLPLPEAVKNFKREIVKKSLTENNSSITGAAEQLGISHQSLSEMLHQQFPDLREEFNLTARVPRGGFKPVGRARRTPAPSAEPAQETLESKTAPEIVPFDLSAHEIVFDDSHFSDDDEIFAFRVSAAKLRQFDIRGDAVIAVARDDFRVGEPFVIYERSARCYDIGIAFFDSFSELLCVYKSDSEPIPHTADEILAIGRIVGYCPLEKITDSEIEFEPLHLGNN